MIKNSFIFIPGIGKKTEEYFWESGIHTWNDFKEEPNLIKLNGIKRKIVDDYISRAADALNKKDISFFNQHLTQKEYWRIYEEFYDKTVFLDIETTGLSLYYDVITLIGTFDGNEVQLFIKDNNLKDIVNHLNNYDIIVTFNGTLFDLPFIKHEFPEIKIPPIHIDLRYLLKSLGINGSLKSIEKKLRIERDDKLKEIDGREAAVLWNKFIKEDDDSLRKLLLYNTYDTTNLKKLMDYCYKEKIKKNILPKINSIQIQQNFFRQNERKKADFLIPPSTFKFPHICLNKLNNALEVVIDNKTLLKVERNQIKRPEIKLNDLINRIKEKGYKPLSIGIDLTGSEAKPSGFCILDSQEAFLSLLKTNEEIVSKTLEINPTIISIDSPLSFPKGRDCPDDLCECRKYGITRECERILKKRGINVYPCLIPSMQKLTVRGIHLSETFEYKGLDVIESYPGAAQDILGFPRKRINLKELEIDLMNMGIQPLSDKNEITHDELDALTSALVGFFYLAGMYEAIGNLEEKYLIIPELK